MNENIIVILAFGLFLFFVWIFWLRHNLLNDFQSASEILSLLNRDLEKRRDTIPYLLESSKMSKAPGDLWNKLVRDRASNADSLNESLQNFINESADVKNLNFLEAKRDVLNLNEHIQKEKFDFSEAAKAFNYRKKTFPFTLVSAIFAVRDLER